MQRKSVYLYATMHYVELKNESIKKFSQIKRKKSEKT